MDYPGYQSLLQIYGTFNRAMLRLVPSLRSFADPLTEAMVEFYLKSQVKHELHVCCTRQRYLFEMAVVMPQVDGRYECPRACSGRFRLMLMVCTLGTGTCGIIPLLHEPVKAGSTLLHSRVDPGLTKVRSELRWRNEEECRTTPKYQPCWPWGEIRSSYGSKA